jgi:hypothetical protein
MGTINMSERIAATLYSLGTLFVSGICVQIPCIKKIVIIIIIIIISGTRCCNHILVLNVGLHPRENWYVCVWKYPFHD